MFFLKRWLLDSRIKWSLKKEKYSDALYFYQKMIQKDKSPMKKERFFDFQILEIAEQVFERSSIKLDFSTVKSNGTKILILNSEIYDAGGHTEVALRFLSAFNDEYKIDFLISGLDKSAEQTAPVKSELIKSFANFYQDLSFEKDICEKIIKIYKHIIEANYTTVFSNIHMHDAVGCAVLGVLKKYTDINVIYWNHCDHYFAVGTEFCDTLITRCKDKKAITPYLAEKTNVVPWLFIEESNEPKIYDEKEIKTLKENLNIPSNAFVSLSGGAFNKFGNEYFEMMKEVLKQNPNVYHIFISSVKKKQQSHIKKIMGEYADRFIMLDFIADFDKFIQMSDLFVDSFPQGAALTLIDFIKYSKPVVIKVNKINPVKSFESYLKPDYPYACETEQIMIEKVSELVNDNKTYQTASKLVREIYENMYDKESIKNEYRKIIR